jgi:signal transduction histidine kinase
MARAPRTLHAVHRAPAPRSPGAARVVAAPTGAVAPPAGSPTGDERRREERRAAGRGGRRTRARRRVRWTAELAVVGAALAWARRRAKAPTPVDTAAADRVARLAEANGLLSSLHQLAQALPSSLDLEQSLDSTVASLRSFWDLHALAVLVPDETSSRWMVVRQEGVRVPLLLERDGLPPALARAAAAPPGAVLDRQPSRDDGLSQAAVAGLYAPLHARGQLIGILAVEHADPGYFGPRDVELLEGFIETVALSLDNARWFARLRTVGADAERTRIARELHDRVGQSLATLGFELDLLSRHSPEEDLRPGIDRLRQDLRAAMAEIRDTLYDLRTDVSEQRGFVPTLESFLERVQRRTGVVVRLEVGDGTERLPLLQEREMWLIAQEAVTNAERHGAPKEVVVRWRSDGRRAALEVVDDGCGFDARAERATTGHGILGMRERAASIGAHLSVASSSGGTSVRCTLGSS